MSFQPFATHVSPWALTETMASYMSTCFKSKSSHGSRNVMSNRDTLKLTRYGKTFFLEMQKGSKGKVLTCFNVLQVPDPRIVFLFAGWALQHLSI